MFSVAVKDHIMIAHGFQGEIFGPAQKLHGATYIVTAAFKVPELDKDGLVIDIGQAIAILKEVLEPLITKTWILLNNLGDKYNDGIHGLLYPPAN
jgi:6-pyruvoyl-tetrahydropterin synthase